jgi:hypothetical protein
MIRRFLLATLIAFAFFGDLALAHGILVSSQIPSVPTDITLSGSTVVDNAAQGAAVGDLADVGGVAPDTFTDLDNDDFQISGNQLQRGTGGLCTAPCTETVTIRVTDANAHTLDKQFTISVSPHGAGNFIQTLTVENDTGSNSAANAITPMFALGFTKGDLPSTQYPALRLSDGTTLSCSLGTHHTTWADGSAKIWGGNFCILPGAVTSGGGTISINVFSGGSAPTASARALTDFALSSTDLKVSGVGQDNLSGTAIGDLNQGVTANGADYIWSDGPAGKCWRVRSPMQISGVSDTQLETWWYVCSLQNASAGFAGVRYLPQITQPYYNLASNYRSFSTLQILNAAATVADVATPLGAGRTFTSTGSGTNLTSTGHGLQTGWLCKVSTSGTLPAPLDSATTYFCASTGTNTFALTTNPKSAASGGSKITLTSAGSGTQTVTPYVYLTAFETVPLANTDGTWRFTQGGGTFTADAGLRVIPSALYLRSAGLIPPYAFGLLTVNSNSTCDWYPMTACFVNRALGTTGERNDIGPETSWAVRYWFNHTAIDERVLRATALVGEQFPLRLRNSTTHALPVVNNTTYSGMPTPNSSFYWSGATNGVGLTIPSSSNVLIGGFDELTTDHLPDFAYVAYLVTGEPQYHDQIAERAVADIYSRFAAFGTAVASLNGTTTIGGTAGAQRNGSSNGTNYYGWAWSSGDLTRADAWTKRDMGAAVAVVTDAENASYPTYVSDLDHVSYDVANAYISMLQACCTYPYTNGAWAEANTSYGSLLAPWANSYLLNSVAMDYARAEYAGALTFGNHIAKWPAHVHSAFGTMHVPGYHEIVKQSPNSRTAPYVTSDAGVTTDTPFALSWNSGTQLFTATNFPIGWTATAGDKFMFNGTNGGTIPAGFSANVPYYAVAPIDTGNKTFKLSASVGGTAITLTDTGSNTSGEVGGYSASITTHVVGSSGLIGYADEVVCSLNNLKSAGGTADQSTIDDLWNYIIAQTNYPSYFVTDPKYLCQGTR